MFALRNTLISALVLLAGCGTNSDEIHLKLELPEEYENSSRIDIQANSSLRMFTQMQFNLHFTAILNHRVEALQEDGIIQMGLNMQEVDLNIQVDQSMFGDEQVSKEMNERSGELARAYESRFFQVTYNEKGEVQHADRSPELEEGSNSAARMNIERIMGTDFMEKLAATQAVFPEHRVRVGESWSTSSTQEMLGMPVKLNNTYTLSSRKNGMASINVSGSFSMDTLSLEPGKAAMPFEGVTMPNSEQVRFMIKGTQAGELQVSEKTGWTRSSSLNQKVFMEFRLGMLTIPVTVENSIRIDPIE